ncbi:hypothetical protein JQ615_17415 [Bradyrhizobium jicamae]|uniref:Uncharacterized protein n=1 Tax=Bradyrhizobium jicamae TaxID=280332 RepID=A0ABS5FK57_9BRAD|nr:hypothetical protein [Bradyrhizobium jicamae]MBR0797174.1 hypothetical protein [Bradyrhizobium jicamae]MBR0934913.1 hypothetical protein [Bradyrhizobium jicamae]
MFQTSILLFLIGAVLAWRFRVWILVPISLVAVIATATSAIMSDTGLAVGFAHCLLLCAAPQMGYAFGLFVRHAIVMARSPRHTSVVVPFKQRAADRLH